MNSAKKIGHLYLFCSSEGEDGTGKESRSSFNNCCRTCHKSSQYVILHCGANKLGQLKTTWINKSSQAGSWNYHATDTHCINTCITPLLCKTYQIPYLDTMKGDIAKHIQLYFHHTSPDLYFCQIPNKQYQNSCILAWIIVITKCSCSKINEREKTSADFQY